MLRFVALPALAVLFATGCAGQELSPASPPRGSSMDPPLTANGDSKPDSQPMSVWRSYKTTSVEPCQVAPIAEASAASIDWAAVGPWPGEAVIAHPPKVGERFTLIDDAIKKVVDLRLHGQPAAVTIGVHFRGFRSERAGDALLFDVAMAGTQSDAGMCHRWTSEARTSGELVLARSNGALVSLRLRGPLTDTEALCPEGARESGVSAAPKTCNRGEVRVEVGRGSVAPAVP